MNVVVKKKLFDMAWVLFLAMFGGAIILVFGLIAKNPPSFESVQDGMNEVRKLFTMCEE